MYLSRDDVIDIHIKQTRNIFNKIFIYLTSYLPDKQYKLISIKQLNKLVNSFAIDVLPNIKYKEEEMDCDDYALLFKSYATTKLREGRAIFIVYGVKITESIAVHHYFNTAILNNKELVVIEPQTATIIHPINKNKYISPLNEEYIISRIVI